MFHPTSNIRKYDRNIFNGSGQFSTLTLSEPIDLLYYFKGNNVVGKLEGVIEAYIYKAYQRSNWLPIQIFHNGVDHCGWVDTNKIELVSN